MKRAGWWIIAGGVLLYTVVHYLHGAFAYQGYDDYFLEISFVREWLAKGTFNSAYVYLYPPLYYLLSVPLARLSDAMGAQIMVVLNQALLVVSLGLLAMAMTPRPTRRVWWLLLLPLALNFRPLLYLLSMAKIELIQITLLIGALLALQRRGSALAGGLIAFAGMMKPLPLLLLLWLVWKRQWRAVGGWLAVSGVVLLISSLVFGAQAVWAYFYNIALPRGVNTTALYWYENQSLLGLAGRMFHHVQPQRFFVNPADVTVGEMAFGWALRLGVLGWLAVLMRPQGNASPQRTAAEWSLALTGMLLLSPFSRDYYAVFLMPAYVLLAHHVWALDRGWKSPAAAVGVLSYLLVGQGFPLGVIHHLPQLLPGIENFHVYLHYGVPTCGYLLLILAWALVLQALDLTRRTVTVQPVPGELTAAMEMVS